MITLTSNYINHLNLVFDQIPMYYCNLCLPYSINRLTMFHGTVRLKIVYSSPLLTPKQRCKVPAWVNYWEIATLHYFARLEKEYIRPAQAHGFHSRFLQFSLNQGNLLSALMLPILGTPCSSCSKLMLHFLMDSLITCY